MERIQEAKAGFRSLTEAIDTTTPAGRMMMQMIGSFAEFERAMLQERTRAGLESARVAPKRSPDSSSYSKFSLIPARTSNGDPRFTFGVLATTARELKMFSMAVKASTLLLTRLEA